MFDGFRRRQIHANGLTFSGWETGDETGRPALLLHGFPDDPSSMVPLATRLADAGYRCYLPYMRGYGETDPDPNDD
ncbi:MAG: hypothetical protein D6761_09760, partial [Candidatus Dadabacteria bacterium]